MASPHYVVDRSGDPYLSPGTVKVTETGLRLQCPVCLSERFLAFADGASVHGRDTAPDVNPPVDCPHCGAKFTVTGGGVQWLGRVRV